MATTEAAPKTMKWWFPLIQGILSIIVGILFLMKPVAASASAVLVLGLYWLIIGIVDLISLFRDRTAWGWKLFMGIIGILAGGLILSGFFGNALPLVQALKTTALVGITLTWVIGFLAIMYGIIALIGAFRGGGWAAGILGVLGIVFGAIILANPVLSAASLPLVIGIWLIVAGIFLIVGAFRMRSA